MIRRKELEAMRHGAKGTLITWQYIIETGADQPSNTISVFTFKNEKIEEGIVSVSLTINGIPVMVGGNTYAYFYQMPKPFMPVEIVTATGLRYAQMALAEDIQNKVLISSAITISVEGM